MFESQGVQSWWGPVVLSLVLKPLILRSWLFLHSQTLIPVSFLGILNQGRERERDNHGTEKEVTESKGHQDRGYREASLWQTVREKRKDICFDIVSKWLQLPGKKPATTNYSLNRKWLKKNKKCASQVMQSCACVNMSKLIHIGMENTKGRGNKLECS